MNETLESELYNVAHNVTRIRSGDCLIHSHPFYEIYYYVKGDVDFTISGVQYRLTPHTLVIIPPNIFHGVHVHTEEPYDRYTVHFDPDLLSFEHRAMLLGFLPNGMRNEEKYLFADMQKTHIVEMLNQFEDLPECGENMQKSLIPIFMEALLARIMVSLPAANRTEKKQASLKSGLFSYVNEHFTEPITLDSLSARFFVSKSQLNQTFRRMTGTTVINYIIHKRVEYAQQLLMSGITASQAATAAGFSDYTTFYRAYKKQFGISPIRDKRALDRPDALRDVLSNPPYFVKGFPDTLAEQKKPDKPSLFNKRPFIQISKAGKLHSIDDIPAEKAP